MVISDPKTEAAVKAYQQDRGVHVDGIVGDQTMVGSFRRRRRYSCFTFRAYNRVRLISNTASRVPRRAPLIRMISALLRCCFFFRLALHQRDLLDAR